MKIVAMISLMLLLLASLAVGQDAPDDPLLETLLGAQEIVVLAAKAEQVGMTSKTFDPIGGDVQPTPGYTETYEHYRFVVMEVMKGKLPDTFEIRVITGERAVWRPVFDPKAEYLMVLAPDTGKDPNGKPRSTYLVTHRALFKVTDGKFEAPVALGTTPWTLEQVRNVVARHAQREKERASQSTEPSEARSLVIAGEDTPRAEQPLSAAPPTRPGGPRPSGEFAEAAPTPATGPGDVDVNKGRFSIAIIVIVVVILIVGLLLLRRVFAK